MKISKLNKKLVLVAATDAIDDIPETMRASQATVPAKKTSAKVTKKAPKTSSVKAKKKAFIIESDDDGEESDNDNDV